MNILGISGLDAAESFKRSHFPGLDDREYRICQGFDSAAALIVDGELVAAAAEERFCRRKHTGEFPVGAVEYCLREAGLAAGDLDVVAHGFDYEPYRFAYKADPISEAYFADVLSPAAFRRTLHHKIPAARPAAVQSVNHHMAHAASAWLTSGWDDCLVIITDGMGETQSLSAYHAHDGKLDPLLRVSALDSIGIFYSLITLHLGFDFNSDEYKIMGLAPYGRPERYREFFEREVRLRPDGSHHIPCLRLNRTPAERQVYRATRDYFSRELMPARPPDAEIRQEHSDVAAALQECLDRVILHVAGACAQRTGQRRLAMAGGVALNCTANGKLMRSGLFDEVYIQPAAGDDGSALGAALYEAQRAGEIRNRRSPVPFFGPVHSSQAVDAAIAARQEFIRIRRFPNLEQTCAEAARLIAAGAVVAWYRGRMEYGPRALGHRSILADPSGPQMRDRINAMVKMREAFRPFAPSATIERAHEWFEIAPGTPLPYMIATVDVREPCRSSLPAVTHVNGSARLQTVSAEDNAEYHELLRAVGKINGREMVLNTSFNVKGQPIVNTPEEALDTFLNTGIDFLFLEDVLVERRGD